MVFVESPTFFPSSPIVKNLFIETTIYLPVTVMSIVSLPSCPYTLNEGVKGIRENACDRLLSLGIVCPKNSITVYIAGKEYQ